MSNKTVQALFDLLQVLVALLHLVFGVIGILLCSFL